MASQRSCGALSNAATITLRTDSVREERGAALLSISQDLFALLLR